MKYMLDTNMCIYVIKHKPEKFFRNLQKTDPGDVCISSITYGELAYGVETSSQTEKNRLALSMLLSNVEIMDFDDKAADEYGRIRADLVNAWISMDPLDMMIAAHGRALGYTIVTNKVKTFSKVKGLKLANWAK